MPPPPPCTMAMMSRCFTRTAGKINTEYLLIEYEAIVAMTTPRIYKGNAVDFLETVNAHLEMLSISGAISLCIIMAALKRFYNAILWRSMQRIIFRKPYRRKTISIQNIIYIPDAYNNWIKYNVETKFIFAAKYVVHIDIIFI